MIDETNSQNGANLTHQRITRNPFNSLSFSELRCGAMVFLNNNLLINFKEKGLFVRRSLKDIPEACDQAGPFSVSMFSLERTLLPRKYDFPKLADALSVAHTTGDATIATIYDKQDNEIALVDLT